jgi:hypothetical protein
MERVSSIFSQIVKLCPRGTFDASVARHQGEKQAKGLTCWSQFIAMLFCQLGGARSLREITGGLAASEGKLRHLGVERAPTRSTLAYANQHRSSSDLRGRLQAIGLPLPGHGQRAEEPLSVQASAPEPGLDDDSAVPVHVEWAKYVKTKGAVKLHLVLDNQGFLPHYAVLSEGRQVDITVAADSKESEIKRSGKSNGTP